MKIRLKDRIIFTVKFFKALGKDQDSVVVFVVPDSADPKAQIDAIDGLEEKFNHIPETKRREMKNGDEEWQRLDIRRYDGRRG